MKLIHLTDTHLVVSPDRLYGLDPRARLAAALDSIRSRHGDADALIITGDLSHWGEEEAYRELARQIGDLPLPVVLMMGNHDIRTTFRTVFPDAMNDGNGFVQGSRVIAGQRLLFLDTLEPGTDAGRYDAERLEWLKQTLAESSEPVLLFMHHPAFPIGISSMDALRQQDSEALWAVLAPHAGRIRHIFMGHIHRPIFGNWHGLSFSILPSLLHQVPLQLDADVADVPGSHEPPAYSVVTVSADAVVCHLDFFMDASKRFPLGGEPVDGRPYALGFTPAA